MTQNENEKMPMDLSRFSVLVAAYGSDPGRWPAQERIAAQLFLASSQDARHLVEREVTLDLVLDGLAPAHISKRLEDAIMASRPLPANAPAPVFAGFGGPSVKATWRPAGIFGTAAVLGIVLGLNIMGPLGAAMSDNGADEILAYALPTLGAGDGQ